MTAFERTQSSRSQHPYQSSHFATAGNETHRHALVFTDLPEPAIDTAVLVAYQVMNKTAVAEAIVKM